MGGWTCNACRTVNGKISRSCSVCAMAKPVPSFYERTSRGGSGYPAYSDPYSYGGGAGSGHRGGYGHTGGSFEYKPCASCSRKFSKLVGTLCEDCNDRHEQQKLNQNRLARNNVAAAPAGKYDTPTASGCTCRLSKLVGKCKYCKSMKR